MSDCRCERCRPDDPAPTYTRAFLLDCLAREIVAAPDLETRRARIKRFAGRMGEAVTADLKDRIARMWTSLKGADGAGEAPPAITPTAN